MKRIISKGLYSIALGVFGFAIMAQANELVLSRAEIAKQGFRPAPRAPEALLQTLSSEQTPAYEAHSLRWPVPFEDARHTIGNVMTQFQDYGGGPYYHGGDDLRVHAREWVTAPISGRLEAGHYSYDMHADGSHQKFWKPWPAQGNHMYFEVAVIDAQGYRFELHHVNRDTLTPEVITALRSGHGTVTAGQKLGQVVEWPNSDTDDTLYHHTHYNIIAPDGATQLNPEHYSLVLGDSNAPVISALYAVGTNVTPFNDGRISGAVDEFVVVASDKLGENIYTHTPAFSRLVFDSGAETVWDFRERLATRDGSFPPIWDFLRDSLTLPNGSQLSTQGNYDARMFLLRLKVPNGARGTFRIEIGDAAGNITSRTGELLL